MMHVYFAPRQKLDVHVLKAMHTLRARIFHERKGWDVQIIGDMEIDGYDALNPYYLILEDRSSGKGVYGCWRILPTTGPNMLRDTFPQLLDGQDPPCSSSIWELSRFAVGGSKPTQVGFSDEVVEAIRHLVRFALSHQVKDLVTVTTVGVERMLKSLGLDASRIGRMQRIGTEKAVALNVSLNEKTLLALYGEGPSYFGGFHMH